MPSTRQPVLVIAGPTASGKSALALDIAESFGGSVINADSMQVYRDLRIITARPSAEDEARAPHRLYGVLNASEACSAARWRDLALAEVAACRRDGRLPILCGGTGLYLKALMDGLSPTPDIPEEIRQDVRRRCDREGPVALHAALAGHDPVMAARLNPTDPQRVCRALEVWLATGRSLADWQDDPAEGPPDDLTFTTIALLPPRDILYDGINRRFAAMVDEGALGEVRALIARDLDPRLPAMKALGVPELAAYLDGAMPLDTAIESAATKSRRYAKRQMTWLRRQIIIQKELNEKYSEKLKGEIFPFVREFGLTA